MVLQGFDRFFKSAIYFYSTVGIRPYKRRLQQPVSLIERLIFSVQITNLYITWFFQIIYLVLTPNIPFLESTLAFSYLGFVAITCLKLAHTILLRRKYVDVLNQLQDMYPTDIGDNAKYRIEEYENKCTRHTFVFSTLYMIAVWTFNLYMIIPFLLFDRLLGVRDIEMELPYLVYIPWQWQGHWSYYALYVSQVMAGYSSCAGQVGNDCLLVGAAAQQIMHYDYIARRLRDYQPSQNQAANLEFLTKLVVYHTKVLNLTEELNGLFGLPLFFNFMISSSVICFLGFLMTVGVDLATIGKLSLFLNISIAEVFIICYYGQEMIEASSSIALAAYEHNWYNSEMRYKRVLLEMVTRAQKPATLKATSYLIISRNTMTFILQISYKFFALLRTIYTK